MTFEEWRSEFHPYPTDNEDFARLAWNAATLIERDRCAKVLDSVKSECESAKKLLNKGALEAGAGYVFDLCITEYRTMIAAIRGSDALQG